MKNSILIKLIIISLFSRLSIADDTNQLYKAIQEYLNHENVNQEFNFSKKIKLPNCKKKLIISKKFNSLKTLKVHCPEKHYWSYNIRINIKNLNEAKIKKARKKDKGIRVIKVKNNINKGQEIKVNDLYYEKTRSTGSINYFTKKDQILGRKVRVSLRKGQIIRMRHVEKNWIIKEGQKVIIENSRANIQILVDGIALKSAMIDEYTDVLNNSTGKVLKAWVKNNKIVSVFR